MPRLLAIGDIHGCSWALDALLKVVKPLPEDRLVLLGDYIDRGPDSRGVVDRLIAMRETNSITFIRGNHELMMLASRKCEESRQFWLAVGGREAISSYGTTWRSGRLENVPESHWQFFQRTCIDWFETERHFFVHACADPDLPLDQQPSSKLHWENISQYTPAHMSGKTMICGHAEQRIGWPLVLPHAICIDTYCYGGGWLTCLDVLSGQMWQANQRGETREGSL